jgi:hypothetical protein
MVEHDNQKRFQRMVQDLSSKVAASAEPGAGRDLVFLLMSAAGAAIGLVFAFFVVLWILMALFSGVPRGQSIASIVTAAISMTALVGASLGAVYAFRKQILAEREGLRSHQQVYTERFVKASELLANDKPSARLAGLHLLASLADDWDEGRDSCARAMCSYLRLPPPSGEGWDSGSGEREVRRTAWQAISKRLIDPRARTAWHNQELDFSGGQFGTLDLRSTDLTGVNIELRGCQFDSGQIVLSNLTFRNSRLDFSGATLRNMTVILAGARLQEGSDIVFDDANIEDCVFILPVMTIGPESGLWWRKARVQKTKFQFDADEIIIYATQERSSQIIGDIDFSRASLTDVDIIMHMYQLSGRLVFDDVVTRDVTILAPRTLFGHPYVNLDVIPEGPTKISVGPGSITGGDLRIRPSGGSVATLTVDFVDYDLAGGEIQILGNVPVWRSFRFDSAREPKGDLTIFPGFPADVEVMLDRRITNSLAKRRSRRRSREKTNNTETDAGESPGPDDG